MSLGHRLARRFTNYQDPRSLGSRLRSRRIAPLKTMIDAAYRRNGRVDIIDIGGTRAYWNILPGDYLVEHNVRITLVNLPGGAKPEDDAIFHFESGNGCDLSRYGDRTFDIAHSNSVLEHVGGPREMQQFASEVRRVAQCYFVQTPNFWFPIEPHCLTPFFHWLPHALRRQLVRKFQLGNWKRAESAEEARQIVDSARLVTKREFRELFPEAEIRIERFFLLPKSLLAIHR